MTNQIYNAAPICPKCQVSHRGECINTTHPILSAEHIKGPRPQWADHRPAYRAPTMGEPTLEEINKLVTFSRDEQGNLEVLDVENSITGNVYGDVYGDVIGSVNGDVRGWKRFTH